MERGAEKGYSAGLPVSLPRASNFIRGGEWQPPIFAGFSPDAAVFAQDIGVPSHQRLWMQIQGELPVFAETLDGSGRGRARLLRGDWRPGMPASGRLVCTESHVSPAPASTAGPGREDSGTSILWLLSRPRSSLES